jgi:hypothetical protein
VGEEREGSTSPAALLSMEKLGKKLGTSLSNLYEGMTTQSTASILPDSLLVKALLQRKLVVTNTQK